MLILFKLQIWGENNLKELIILKPGGERLREVRLKLGLTQEDLAGKNMSKKTIYLCLKMEKDI